MKRWNLKNWWCTLAHLQLCLWYKWETKGMPWIFHLDFLSLFFHRLMSLVPTFYQSLLHDESDFILSSFRLRASCAAAIVPSLYVCLCTCSIDCLTIYSFSHSNTVNGNEHDLKWIKINIKYAMCTRNTWHWCVLNVQHSIFSYFMCSNSSQVISNWNKCCVRLSHEEMCCFFFIATIHRC